MSQTAYSRLWDGYASDKEAKEQRDADYKAMKKTGKNVTRFTLRNQVKKYDGLGQPNGASCHVYFIQEN